MKEIKQCGGAKARKCSQGKIGRKRRPPAKASKYMGTYRKM